MNDIKSCRIKFGNAFSLFISLFWCNFIQWTKVNLELIYCYDDDFIQYHMSPFVGFLVFKVTKLSALSFLPIYCVIPLCLPSLYRGKVGLWFLFLLYQCWCCSCRPFVLTLCLMRWSPDTRSLTHCIKNLWAHNLNLLNMWVALTWNILMRSGHNFAHAMTAQLSWHVQNYDVIVSLE